MGGRLPGSKKKAHIGWLPRGWQPSRTTPRKMRSEKQDVVPGRAPASSTLSPSASKTPRENEQGVTLIPWADKNGRNHNAHSSYHKLSFCSLTQQRPERHCGSGVSLAESSSQSQRAGRGHLHRDFPWYRIVVPDSRILCLLTIQPDGF